MINAVKDNDRIERNIFFDENRNIGFKDEFGNVIIKPIYVCANDFSEDLAAVGNENGWGFVDLFGNEVVRLQYFEVSDFHEGYALTYNPSLGCMYIDKNGNQVSTYYEYATDFHNGVAWVVVDNKYGLIDKDFKFLINPSYNYAKQFDENGLSLVQKGNRAFFIDKDNKKYIHKKVLKRN